MASQKIAQVEKAECKRRELELDSPRNHIQRLTLKKTMHAQWSWVHTKLCWAPPIMIYLV